MRQIIKKHFLKAFVAVTVMVFMANQANAQTTSDVIKGSNAVKVVDNMGTIKYFQSNNGITQITNTTNDVTTTTWQLGGTLTADTYIDASGKAFALDGLALASGTVSTDATTKSLHGTGTGYTLLVRDEATGAVQKMLATSLIDAGVYETVLTADYSTTPFTTAPISGLATVSNRISVFRNGIKLRQTGTTPDWVLSSGTIVFKAAAGNFYKDDIIEVQWVK